MLAAQLIAPGRIAVGECVSPIAPPGQILIRVAHVGLCGSDLSLFLGHRPVAYPHILGHELVGTVEALGEGVSAPAPGTRVIVEPNYPCGACRFCLSGRGVICPHKLSMGVNLPGCLAQFAIAPARFVWPVPDAISDQDAATIEPLAVAVHALAHSGAVAGDTIAIVGCGAIGLLLTHVAVAQGIRVLAHDKSPVQLQRAAALGAQPATADDTASFWEREVVSVVFECAGAVATVELALAAAPRGGKVILLGLSTQPASFVPLRLVREGITVQTSLIYDHPADFARSIELVADGTLHPGQIVTSQLPLAEAAQAFARAASGSESKVHLHIA